VSDESALGTKVRLIPAARRAASFVWGAARRELLLSLIFEIVNALALVGILLAGREVVLSLTSTPGPDSVRDVLPATILLGASLAVSGTSMALMREFRLLVALLTVRRTQHEIIRVATSVPYQQFETRRFNDLLQRANTEGAQSTQQMVFDLLGLANLAITSLSISAVLVATVPEVVPALILIGLPFAVAARVSARLAYKTAYQLTTRDRLRRYLYQALTRKEEAKEVRVLGIAGVLTKRWDDLHDERITEMRQLTRRRVMLNGAASLASAILIAGVLVVVVRAAVEDQISLADAAVAIVALQQLSTRVRAATNSAGSLRRAALFLYDFDSFRAMEQVGEDQPSEVSPPSATLRAEGVSFTYPGTERQVLENVSLEIAPGEIVALVGVSGSGKSTLAHLLAGLYEPTVGRVTYGEDDIADLPGSAYWPAIGPVFQDYARYELTARENIGLSDRDRLEDIEGIERAAERAGIADALENLQHGYETWLSRGYDDGAELSAGQWQRLAIARAFFRDAPVLILDEPAASLDAINEKEMFNQLVELVADRSVLMISHRFSTVRLAHRIVVLRGGRIVEQGTHDELVAQGGQYAELFRVQAAGYLPDP